MLRASAPERTEPASGAGVPGAAGAPGGGGGGPARARQRAGGGAPGPGGRCARAARRAAPRTPAGARGTLPAAAHSPGPGGGWHVTERWHGVFTILLTPFTEDGALDEDSLRREADFVCACGAHGLVTPVNSSEFYLLADD